MRKLKRIAALALCLALICSLLPGVSLRAHAETLSGTCGAEGDNLTWSFDPDTGLLTIEGSGAMENFDHLAPWFDYCESITAVSLPEGLTSVGSWAFLRCKSLTDVSIPDSVVTIEEGAFNYCESLTDVSIGNSVTVIGEAAFTNSSLTEVTIPDSVTRIGDYAFSQCSALTDVSIGSSVTRIGGYAFFDCTSLTSVTIPGSVTIIDDDYAFGYYHGGKLKKVDGFTIYGYSNTVAQIYAETNGFDFVSLDEAPSVVTFSVLGDLSVIEPMVCDPQTGITLPTAEGPQGYHFLGWVLEECVNAAEQPETVLTGEYFATGDVTLLALFTYNDYGENPPTLTQMGVNDTFSDGDKIVISESTGTYGLYQKAHNYAYVSNFAFTEDPEEILADELKYFDVTQVEGGWYLGDEVNGWLYTPDNQTNLTIRYNTAFMTAFTLTTYEGHLALQHTVSYNDNVFYVNCGTNLSGALTNKWRMVNANNMSGISTLNIYKLNEGGPALARYTTTLHTHTPGEPVVENSAAATCTEPGGYDTAVYCTECGAELSRVHTDVPALGHDFGDWDETTPPSCTEAGEETRECSRCDATETRPIEALGHDLIHHDGQPATCTEAGWEAYDSCSRCDYTSYEEIPALGHDYQAVVTEPTCTEAGYTTHTCSRCGDHYTDDETEALGHAWNEGVVTAAPTHRAAGEMTYTCTRCNATRTEVIEKLGNPFEDVIEGESYFFDPVMWALDNSVTAGVDDTHFGPAASCTRAQIMTFLWRASGSPEPETAESPFSDVAEGQYFYKAVLWAVDHNVTAGMGDGTFGANATCTREQAMAFLWKAKGSEEPETTTSEFSDVTEGQYFYKAVLWAVEHGVTAGMGDGTFGVGKTCVRGQIITFLFRAFGA